MKRYRYSIWEEVRDYIWPMIYTIEHTTRAIQEFIRAWEGEE